MAVKFIYGKLYWIEKLIEIGKAVNPAKYTPAHIESIESHWMAQSITDIVCFVNMKQSELKT